MSLEVFSRDIVPILNLLIAIIALIALVYGAKQIRLAQQQLKDTATQIGLTKEQIRDTANWNKMNAQLSLSNNLPNEDHEKRFWRCYENYKDFETGIISKEKSIEIYENIDDWTCVKEYLNRFERYCAAVNAGYIDKDYAYHSNSSKVINLYNKLHLYIFYSQERLDDNEIYVELAKLSVEFKTRHQAAEKKRLEEKGISAPTNSP